MLDRIAEMSGRIGAESNNLEGIAKMQIMFQ